jgi:hypothetical protein
MLLTTISRPCSRSLENINYYSKFVDIYFCFVFQVFKTISFSKSILKSSMYVSVMDKFGTNLSIPSICSEPDIVDMVEAVAGPSYLSHYCFPSS